MSKQLAILICILAACVGAKDVSSRQYYVATNPLSPLAGTPVGSATAFALIPLITNLEYGLTLAGGVSEGYSAGEARITLGRSNPYNRIVQLQTAYLFHAWGYWKQQSSGWYTGASLRYWDYYNTDTETHLHNFTTNLLLGYQWESGKWLWDLRLNQPLTIYSVSSIEHTESKFRFCFSPMDGLSPVLPFIGFTVGRYLDL